MANFRGRSLTTHGFPKDGVDFGGRRVAVIGTGSTAVQTIPEVAKTAAELFVFQRTPAYVGPAMDTPRDPAEEQYDAKVEEWKKTNQRETGFGMDIEPNPTPYAEQDPQAFLDDLERRWQLGGFGVIGGAPDIVVNLECNEVVAEFFRKKIRETVKDPKLADDLTPHYAWGCKRGCISDGYYETFNRENVKLVPLKGKSIEAITEKGLVALGKEYEVDDIIYATVTLPFPAPSATDLEALPPLCACLTTARAHANMPSRLHRDLTR